MGMVAGTQTNSENHKQGYILKMKVLVACEFSGIVREAFAEKGHDAWSCDFLPTESSGKHYQLDIKDILRVYTGWDMLIAFPPCTYLAVSGARWFKGRQLEQAEAIEFVEWLWDCGIPKVA
ncbi:MAG: hypothetical protein IIC01_02640, partial [Planctomycetes bacterium]|nr:hypothetical protein [Planctomycetota bacterium]